MKRDGSDENVIDSLSSALEMLIQANHIGNSSLKYEVKSQKFKLEEESQL